MHGCRSDDRKRLPAWAGLALMLCASVAWAVDKAPSGNLRETAPSTEPASTTQPATATQPASVDRAYMIPLEGAIDSLTDDVIRRRLEPIREQNPQVIIVELDTPGGELGATLEICEMLKAFRDDGVRVYAWVNNMAYSAGTIIALATDGIIMTRNATIGDCQPIFMIPGGGASAVPEEIEAKVTSPLIEELEDSLRRNPRYDRDMVFALIRPDMEVFWVENTADPANPERRFVTREERDKLFGWTTKPGAVGKFFGTSEPDESRTSWRYVEEAPELGKVHQPIVEKDRLLLTMRTPKALAYGFCMATVNDEKELRQYLNINGEIQKVEAVGAEVIIEFLASPAMRSLLFMLILVGAYVEFKTPGFGAGGSVAIVALIIFLGAPYLAGIALPWSIVLVVIGVILLAIEAFVIPGFGVAGITGIVVLLAGLLMSYVPGDLLTPATGEGLAELDWGLVARYLERGALSLGGGMGLALLGMVALAHYLPKIPIAGRVILTNPDRKDIEIEDPYHGVAQVGDLGTAESLLRPSGKARFGSILVDVVTEGDHVPAHSRIEVVERHGNRVVVRRVE